MNVRRKEQPVSVTWDSRTVHTLSMHLGDIIPDGLNYMTDDNCEIVIVVHYLDDVGRDRTKKISFDRTGIA